VLSRAILDSAFGASVLGRCLPANHAFRLLLFGLCREELELLISIGVLRGLTAADLLDKLLSGLLRLFLVGLLVIVL
jgi:hypothetical protein